MGYDAGKATRKKKTPTIDKKAPVLAPVIPIGVPRYLNSLAGTSVGGTKNTGPSFLPDNESLITTHQDSIQSLSSGYPKTDNDSTITARASSVATDYGPKQFSEITVSAGGDLGAVDMHDTFVFDPSAAPEDTLDYDPELKLPPTPGRTNPYPIQLSFRRELSYADKKGRIVRMEFVASLGFSTANWKKNTIGIIASIDSYEWYRLRSMAADHATATLIIDGGGVGDEYFSFAVGDGDNISFESLWQSLNKDGSDPTSLDFAQLVLPEAGAGSQFQAIQNWLDDVDAKRWRDAHPDKAWYEKGIDLIGGVAKSVYKNTVGAVVQAGLQVWDMQRLYLAVILKKTGIADYQPEMWSDTGKAAEQGQGTGDLLKGMFEGIYKIPSRGWDAWQRGDFAALGEEMGNAYFAVEGARSGVKAAPGLARAGLRGLGGVRSWLGALGESTPSFGEAPHLNELGAGTPVDSPASTTTDGTLSSRTMAGTIPPKGTGNTPTDIGVKTMPDLGNLDTAHYQWVDEMRAATKGEGPEPTPWKGPKPQLDMQGTWSGWDPAEAYAAHQVAVREGNGMFEANIARNDLTGQYKVMLGKHESVAPPAGDGWRDVLHNHPNLEAAPRFTLPASQDVLSAFQANWRSALPNGRPHIEFVESFINGKPTRVAIVKPDNVSLAQLELGAGVPGPQGTVSNAHVMLSEPFQYQKFWWAQEAKKPLLDNPAESIGRTPAGDPTGTRWVPPGTFEYTRMMREAAQQFEHVDMIRDLTRANEPTSTQWVPPNSQAYRSMMIDTAKRYGHVDLAESMKSAAPEYTAGSSMRTQAGTISTPDAPRPTRAEMIAQSPPGSIYDTLKQIPLTGSNFTRLTNSLDPDKPLDLASGMHIARNVKEMQTVMAEGKLAGALASNGRFINPSVDLSGQPYWVVIQRNNGEVWLIPSHLVNKFAGGTANQGANINAPASLP